MVAQMYILAADQRLTEFQILLPCSRDCTFLCDPSSCSDSTNTQQRAQVRHLNCWGSWTVPRQSRSTLWVELIKGRFTSSPSVVSSIYSQWLEILDQIQHQVQHLVQPRPETDTQRSTPVKPPFPTVENLRIVTTQYIALLVFTWGYKYLSLPISFPAKLPFFTLQPPALQSMHSRYKEKGCVTCPSQQETRSEKQGSQSTGTFFYCWQDTILMIKIFFVSYKDPMEGVSTQGVRKTKT